MNISNWSVLWKLMTGGVSGLVEYVLEVLKNALASLKDTTKEKIQAALNLALKVMSILESVKILIPTKWQSAYQLTLDALKECCTSLEDLEITSAELDIIVDKIEAAYKAWQSPDDATCVSLVCKGGVWQVA